MRMLASWLCCALLLLPSPAAAQQTQSGLPASLPRDCVGRYRGRTIDVCDPNVHPMHSADEAARLEAADGPLAGGAPEAAAYARRPAWIARVSVPGLVRLTGAELVARGAPTQFARLCARWRGHVLPLQHIDGDGDGVIDAAEEVRWYAPGAGDRYNADDAYWISDEPTCHAPMPAAAAGSLTGPVRETARQRGIRRVAREYLPQQAGPDGDHWYAATLTSQPSRGDSWVFEATAVGDLPVVDGPAVYTVSGVTRVDRRHDARLTGGGWDAATTWSGSGDFHVNFRATTAQLPTAFTLNAGALDVVLPEAIEWERAVALSFGGVGASFIAAADGVHRLLGVAESRVYDVTDPLLPTVVALASGRFEAVAGREYFVGGAGERVTTATLERYTPLADLGTPRNVEAIYLAPQTWLGALEPLLAHRRASGISATSVPVEAIYAQFGHGQISPAAIRDFLRSAYSTWSKRPRGVVLVGDATFDVRDYLGWGFPNVMPPYFADVDPYDVDFGGRGEAPCESCFAQLDYDDPLADKVPDLIFGRIPAQSAGQAASYVEKLLRYELSSAEYFDGSWRTRVLYLVDDAVRIDGTADPAGQFWQTAEQSIGDQNFYAAVRRWYYDPTGALGGAPYAAPAPSGAVNMPYSGSRALFAEGAALVNYIGHASQNRIGDLGRPDLWDNYLLHQDDADTVANGDRQPILLMMTCLTGAYTYAYSDTVNATRLNTAFDERMVMAEQGAIAAWGPTGLSVSDGHDALLRGFYRALWGPAGRSKTLGELAQAGYLTLFQEESAARAELIRMYMITGDPFLRPRLYAPRVMNPADASRVYAPAVVR